MVTVKVVFGKAISKGWRTKWIGMLPNKFSDEQNLVE